VVKPKDNTTANLQSGLPALDPNVQVEPVPTPGQQSQIISDFEKTTGKTFTPTTTEPTTFVGQPKPDTRSVQQKRIDTSAQLEADKQIDTSGFSQTDGVYIKKNNKWRFIPRNKFLDGVNPGSLMFEEEFAPGKFQTQQFGAKGPEVIPIIGTVISHPFKFFKRAGSAAIKKTEPWADSIPYTEWAENVVGSTVKGTGYVAQSVYDSGIKPIIRKGTTLAMAPLQIVENLLFFAPSVLVSIMGDGGGIEKSDASIWDQVKGIFTNTTLYQTGLRPGEKEGEGFFAGKEIEEKRNKLEEELRFKVYGQTATMGRIMTGLGVATNVIEVGDDLHSFISGSIDGLGQVFLDPLNVVRAPNALKTVGEIPSALATPAQQRALVKAGVILKPETVAAADDVLARIGKAGELNAAAEALITPQPGVFWSGDRNAATRGGPIDQFLDITDPAYVPNTNNLLQQGLYISDGSPLTTSYSSGRTGADEIIQIGSKEILVPGISDVPGEALVYEFRVPETDFNIIDAEAVWPTDPSLPYNLNAALDDLGFSENVFLEIQNALADQGIQVRILDRGEFVGDSLSTQQRILSQPLQFLKNHVDFRIEDTGQFFRQSAESQISKLRKSMDKSSDLSFLFIPRRNNKQVFVDGKLSFMPIQETLANYTLSNLESGLENLFSQIKKEIPLKVAVKRTRENTQAGQVGQADVLANLDSELARLSEQTKAFDTILEQVGSAKTKMGQEIIDAYPNTSLFTFNRELFEEGITELENVYTQIDSLYSELINNNLATYQDLEYVMNQLEGVSQAFSFGETKITSLGDIGPYKDLKFTSSSYGGRPSLFPSFDAKYQVDSLPWTHARTGPPMVVNDWLASKGVDALRYDGGVRIGGYGNHEAMAVLKPSKLTVVTARTGENLPTIEAKRLIEEGQQLSVSAEDIAIAQGYKDAAGLIEGARTGADASRFRYWLTTGRGQNLVQAITNDADAYNIWLTFLKGRSPRLAQKMADAKTVEEVEKLLNIAAHGLDPFERMSSLPGWSGNAISELGYRTKNLVSKNSRIAATVPHTNMLPLDDFVAGAKNLHDTMLLFNVPLEIRAQRMNEYLRIVAGDDYQVIKGQLFDFAKTAKESIVRTRIDPLLEKLRKPLAKPFDEMTPFERLTMNRRLEVADEIEEFARKAETMFNGSDTNVTKYVIDDLGQFVPLEHLDGNGAGPLYPSQQNNSGFELFPLDADEYDKFYALTERWAYYREVSKTLPGMGRTSEILNTAKKWGFGAQTTWKKMVLFGGRYTARVVSEEVARNALSGVFSGSEFSYVSEVLTGRLNKNIYGQVFPSINEAEKIVLQLDEINVLSSRIERALQNGDQALVNKLQKRLDKIDQSGLEGRLAEIESLLEKEVSSVRDVMIGPKTNGASDTVLGQSIPGYVRQGVQQVVSRTERSTLWLQGIAQEVVERSVNPAARATARAIFDGSPYSLTYVAKELYEGTLRKSFETYFKQEGKLKPGYNWDSLEGATTYVQQMRDDLMQVTGGHPTLLKAIFDEGIRSGEELFTLGRLTAEGNIPSKQLLNIMRDGDGSTAAFATWEKAPELTTVFPKAGIASTEKKQELFSWFMQHTYGAASDKFARIPFWNRRRWNLIADMAPSLSKAEAKLLAQTIDSYGLPKYVVENVIENLKRANGNGTLAEIDNLAGIQATQDTINLLFDARKRTQFGRNHRILFPFFDAFREVGTQLIKTGINPIATHKIDKAQQALGNFTIGGPGNTQMVGPGDVDGDGKSEGFVYKDPTTGKPVYNIPLVGTAARALTGIPFDFKINVGSMSLVTSVIPSVGPVVALTYSAIPNRNGETWDSLNKLVLPFGMANAELVEYFTPLAIRRIAQGAAAGTPFESVVNLLGNPNNDPVFITMNNRVLMHELASGDYEQNEQGIKQAMETSQNKTAQLWFLRGLTQFFAPAAPISQFYAEKDSKLIPLGVMLEGIRSVQNKVKEGGGTFNDQIDALINQFGTSVLPYLASVSKSSIPGAESSKAFYRFETNNPELFKKYPNVAGYFGPNGQEFDQEIYNLQRRSDELSVRETDDVAKQVAQLWGNYSYFQSKKTIEEQVGLTPMGMFALNLVEQQLRASFPDWNRQLAYQEYDNRIVNAVNKIQELSVDKQFANLPSMPILQTYFQARQLLIAKINGDSKLVGATSWKNNRGGIVEREALKAIGDDLANKNPVFAPLWDSVLSKEFKILTEQEKLLAKTGQLP
jgi:hypothetical protein